mgnify:FL=1
MDLVSGQLFTYIHSVQACISPPIAAVFLIGITRSRVNATGAVAALTIGFVLGMSRLLLEMNKASLDGFLLYVAEINFLHFAIVLFAFSVASLVGFSLLTAPPPDEKVRNLTYQTVDARMEEIERGAGDPNWRRNDAILSAVVLVVIAFLWWHFSY